MRLGPLFHWAPADRYPSINQNGLRPGSTPTVATTTLDYVCLGLSPRDAWEISGGMDHVEQVEEWDLWQATLGDNDAVFVRPEFGADLCEVKVRGAIPADRLWHVARRRGGEPSGWGYPVGIVHAAIVLRSALTGVGAWADIPVGEATDALVKATGQLPGVE